MIAWRTLLGLLLLALGFTGGRLDQVRRDRAALRARLEKDAPARARMERAAERYRLAADRQLQVDRGHEAVLRRVRTTGDSLSMVFDQRDALRTATHLALLADWESMRMIVSLEGAMRP